MLPRRPGDRLLVRRCRSARGGAGLPGRSLGQAGSSTGDFRCLALGCWDLGLALQAPGLPVRSARNALGPPSPLVLKALESFRIPGRYPPAAAGLALATDPCGRP